MCACVYVARVPVDSYTLFMRELEGKSDLALRIGLKDTYLSVNVYMYEYRLRIVRWP